MAADRHLLFGLLALQNGLIQQAQLVAAFHAWTIDKSRPLAGHLVALGHLNDAQCSAIEALAALHVEAHGGDLEKSLDALRVGGSTLDQLGAIGDPEISESLTGVGHRSSEPDPDRTDTVSFGTTTAGGQRFRVLRPYARGGLGAVFVALDSELNREVALKEILDERADDPVSRQRFLLEAEITSGLEHPGIVPVYGLGTYAGGRPYYAMRLIKGDSLKDAIALFHADVSLKRDSGRRSLELRKLLRRFLDVCNAIQYAHSRGVLHRDIKPGNVIVGKHGETLVVDWGLAKAVGRSDAGSPSEEKTLVPSSASGSAETLPGSVLGTPAYMSPEQARGDLDALGPRSDVYSLGATLYCLLTGKPPFEGGDVGAVLRAVGKGKFSPPRAIDSTIDSALEAICLTAMAVLPADRYGSPRALAEDLERWAADEPVTAYPESLRMRLGRWERRHRAWVRAGAASLAFLLGLSVLFAVEQGRSADRLRGEQKKTEAALAAEALQRQSAETQAERASSRLYFVKMNAVQRFWEDYQPLLFKQFLYEQLPVNQEGNTDRRGFEWFYWERQFVSGHRTLMGHTDRLQSATFSPDGTRLASASWDGTVKVWDAATGREAFSLKGHTSRVTSVAFSPDGTRLAFSSWDEMVRVWNLATGREALTLKGHTGAVISVAFSPDGKQLASGSGDTMVRVWNLATGREALTLKGHSSAVRSVAFSPDGTRLASGSGDNTVKLWDVAIGREALTLKSDCGADILAFSPDGTRLAAAMWVTPKSMVKLWDAATGREVLTIGPDSGVSNVAFSPDSKRLASAGIGATVKLWDASTGREVLTLNGRTDWIGSVAFSPDGTRLASASMDGTVKVRDAATGREAFTLKGHTYRVASVAFSPDGTRLASASDDHTVKLWDAITGQEPLTLKGLTGPAVGVVFSPDGTRLATAGPLKLWDASTGQEALAMGHDEGAWSMAFSPDGKRLASAGIGETVKVWDAATGHQMLTLNGHTDGVVGVAFSPDGTRLASASSDKTVKLWDASTGREALTLQGHTDRVRCVTFSPDGTRLASASDDHTVRVWNLATGREALTLKGHTAPVHSVAFSPDGKRLVSASQDATVKLWDAASGREAATLTGIIGWMSPVALSPDGTRLAAGTDDGTVTLWDVATGQQALTLKGHTGPVWSVAFSPDGKRLASTSFDTTLKSGGSWDQTVKIWDTRPLDSIAVNATGP